MSKGKMRARFSDATVWEAVEKATRKGTKTIDYNLMSKLLSDNSHGTKVSPQLCVYWAKQFDTTKKNGEHYATLAKPNRKIKESRKLRKPTMQDSMAQVELPISKNESILVIPDIHAPYQHPDTIAFLIAVAAKYRPDQVVNLGDETDQHAMSFHDSDPNLDSAGMELEKSRIFIGELERVFPRMLLCDSNHGSMLYRKAKTHGIPVEMIKTYREVLFPKIGDEEQRGMGWEWAFAHRLDLPNGEQVQFQHQASGDLLAAAAHERCNLVIGHLHGKFAIHYAASKAACYWAMNGGCLIDAKSMAFSYGENFKNKPIIGCSVIVDSLPILVPMRLGVDGRWTGHL